MKAREVAASGGEVVGRYTLHQAIAKGGMATVHVARLVGPEDFSRVVAAKRLFPHFAHDEDFVAMFLDEARIASKIHHPNVVPVLDVVISEGDVVLVQEYVHGVPLERLVRLSREARVPILLPIVTGVMAGVLSGLHAAHEARDDHGEPLNIVHRDVSPHNVLVTADGIARILDFGIAKARSSSHVTRQGVFKGKIAYVAPEQLGGVDVTRLADVYSSGVVLWELITGRRMFANRDEEHVLACVLRGELPRLLDALLSERRSIPEERWAQVEALDPIVSRALAREPEQRFPSAAAMLEAMLRAVPAASAMEIGAWVKATGGMFLDANQRLIAMSEESARKLMESSRRMVVAPASDPTSSAVRPQQAASRQELASVPVMFESPEPRSKVRAALFAGLGLACVAASVAAALAIRGCDGDAQKAAAPAPSDSALSASAPPPSATGTPANTSATDAAAIAAPVADAPRPVLVQQAAPRRGAKSAPPPPPKPSGAPPPTPPAAPDCSPPYYMDGYKKVYKPGCI